MYNPIPKLVSGYAEWLTDLAAEGRPLWLGTVLFHHLARRQAVTLNLMQQEMQRIFTMLLTNIVRNPKYAPCEKLPLLIGCPDRPVAKHHKTRPLKEIKINGGLHYHFILAEPIVSRLKLRLDEHIDANQAIYLGQHGIVSKVHVTPVTELAEQLLDYLFKHIKRRSFTGDDILLLPVVNKTKDRQIPSELR